MVRGPSQPWTRTATPTSDEDDDMMTADAPAHPLSHEPGPTFEVRSVTGACYTIVEEVGADGSRTYCTAHARLPVIANDDGTFTIADTRTRLVRVDPRR
jgi:hypothetical protein